MLYKYRKIIIAVIVLVIIITPVVIYVNYINSIQKVIVTFDSTLIQKVDIYDGDATSGISSGLGEFNQTIQQGKEMTLKKGIYTLKPTGENINDATTKLIVGDTPVSENITADYNNTYLATKLNSELPGILAALDRDSPNLKNLYSLNEGSLYKHGEWFGSTLNYTGTDSLSRDRLRFVMKKETNGWVLVTNPPSITLAARDYPQIPHDVLSKVNAIDLGLPVLLTN
ncbi:MAG: hypothetical protein ABIQ04_04420 [Candidatus Saccharimonadales bacterium]